MSSKLLWTLVERGKKYVRNKCEFDMVEKKQRKQSLTKAGGYKVERSNEITRFKLKSK